MAEGSLGDLVVKLTAETVEFKDSLTRAAQQMDASVGQMVASTKGLQSALGNVDKQLGAFGINLRNVLGLAAGGAFAGLIASSIESAAHVSILSQQTGIAAGELAAMKGAAAAGGISLDEVAKASLKFSKAIETQNEDSGKASAVLTAMGLSMDEVKNHSPAEQLKIVAERLNTFADGSGKAAAAQILFGKSGAEALVFLKYYGEQIGTTKEGYAEYAANAEKFEQSLQKLKAGSQGLVNQYAQQLLPSLQGVANGFLAMNSTKSSSLEFMSLVGEGVRVLALGFASLWTIVKDVAIAVVAGAKIQYAALRGDMEGVAKAVKEARDGWSANADALLAFSDKALEGSKVFRDTADATAGIGKAAEGAKPKLKDLTGETTKAAQEGQKWVDALQKSLDKLTLTESEMLKLEARQKGLGDSADKLIENYVEFKKAMEDAKKADEAAEAAMHKSIDTAVTFHDKIANTTAELGLGESELLKYQARLDDLGDSEDANIDRLIAAKVALKNYQDGITRAIAEWDAYVKGLDAVRTQTGNVINAWLDGNKALATQIANIGLTKVEVERLAAANQFEADQLKINLEDDATRREAALQVLRDQYAARLALINSQEMKQAYVDSATAAEKAYESAAKTINEKLVDAITTGFKSGKSLAEDFKNAVVGMFKNLVLKPILQPVSNYLAGLYQDGVAGLSGMFGIGSNLVGGGALAGTSNVGPVASASQYGSMLGASNYGGWGGIAAGAAIGGYASSQYGSKDPTYGTIAGGAAMVGLAGSTGVAATAIAGLVSGTTAAAVAAGTASTAAAAAFASAAAVVPVVGWIIAAIAIIASFAIKPGGGPKVGSFQSADYIDGVQSGRSGYTSSGGGDAAGMRGTIKAFNDSYQGYIAALGGTGIGKYSVHSLYETDPQGTASSYGMFIVAKPGQNPPGNDRGQTPGERIDSFYNSGKFAPTADNFQLYANRAVLAALQASKLPDDIAHLIDGLVPNALGTTQIQNVLAFASAFHSLPDVMKAALDGITGLDVAAGTSVNLARFGAAYKAVLDIVNGNPAKDAQDSLDVANQTAIEKFRAQGVALISMSAAFDGSADAALRLAGATATYYQNQVQLLAALDQASAVFHKSIADAERGLQLDTLDSSHKIDFYRDEVARNRASLTAAAGAGATADPNEVVRLGEQSKGDLLAWWALLDQTQKQDNYAYFKSQFDVLDTQVSGANKAIADAIKLQNDPSNPNSPIAQVKGAFDKFMLDMGAWLEQNKGVATEAITAAAQMAGAADTMAGAADTMLTAANTPNHIDLTVNGSEVTAGSG